ncbi:MAG: NAD-dependent deacylase [Planctomycetes bacterium]|nr:NAD-dependent deacylase [Planctomycetota bacterium]
MQSLDEAARAVRGALGSRGRLTVLTGAGMSAESGVATFRGAGGLWEKHRLEDVATPEGFLRDPRLVLEFYNARRRQLRAVRPNAAHEALARLEGALVERLALITQNIDDLHERAGSRRILHMHGEILKARCVSCEAVLPWPGDITLEDACPACGDRLRPHVVWFGEMPFHLEEEIPRALEAEVFLAIGTSGTVYPAAGMAAEARLRGRLTVELNLDPSEQSHIFDHCVRGPAGTTVPAFVERILAEQP